MAAPHKPTRANDTRVGALRQFVELNPTGRYVGRMRDIEQIGPRRMVYVPDRHARFGFVRSTGEEIFPGEFEFDFGSVPILARGLPNLSPIEYGPTYLVHDWDFHMRGQLGPSYHRSFKAANRTLAEGLRTLDQIGHNGVKYPCPDWTLYAIYSAVNSPIGHRLWTT